MTMPKTATVMKSLPQGVLPEEMSNREIQAAMLALKADLPGSPIGYIERVAPASKLCGCGAIHLQTDASGLSSTARTSLHRLLATPYGDIVREHMRRSHGYATIRFGWSGLRATVPTFLSVVDNHEVRNVAAGDISSPVLNEIVAGFARDMPNVMHMIKSSATCGSVHSVAPQPSDVGQLEWKHLIDQVMFTWSTPVRKYLSEWLKREFGLYGGAVNCCIVMTGNHGSESDWRRRWMDEQTNQQLTPDC